MYKRYGALSSSVNPMELATSVLGFIRFLAGTLGALGILSATDIDLVNIAADGLLAQIAIIVPAGVAAYGFIEMIYGLLRKVVVWFSAR